jgi:hypothetical protein
MAGYIRKAIGDRGVQAAAEYAWRHFGEGEKTPAMLWWAAFWYVKHCVKFRVDEATMFRIGAQNSFDLLIAPDVLVRMQDPAEDCDGFTMLVLAIFAILCGWFLAPGVAQPYIATVAAGAEDPERWSHVFGLAVIGGRVMPLDASQGPGPGWMVPREHIYRFQAWDLDGRPVDVAPARFQGLHGYVRSNRAGMGAAPAARWMAPPGWRPKVISLRHGMGAYRRRGIGQDEGGVDLSSYFSSLDTGSGMPSFGSSSDGSFFTGGMQLGSTPNTSSWLSGATAPGSSFNWTSFLNNLVGTAGSVAKVAETPMTTYRLPDGTVVTTPIAQNNAALTGFGLSSLSQYLPYIGLGLLGLFALSAVKK